MAINLSRNTKVYFTTSVSSSNGALIAGDISSANTFELQVLDGYTFSQGTQQQNIQISEAGANPSRGQRAFNTQLDPVEWSISTYARPYLTSTGLVASAERVLWNALLGDQQIASTGTTIQSLTRGLSSSPTATLITSTALTKKFVHGDTPVSLGVEDIINIQGFIGVQDGFNEAVRITAVTGTTYSVEFATAPAAAAGTLGTTTAATVAYAGHWATGTTATSNYSYTTTMGSNKNSLQKFAMIFVVDQVTYCVENCALDQVSIDFGLDAIAMMAWTGKGTKLNTITAPSAAALTNASTAVQAVTSANYITNKLSTLTLQPTIGGSESGNTTSYSVPLTGGNITIANNINYLVPTNLAVVNTPIGYYTGQRAISGSLSAYLRTGSTTDTGQLLKDILAASNTTTEPKYKLQVELGGVTAANRIEFQMDGVVLQVPSVNVEDVVATTINFSAQGFDPLLSNQAFDITKNNDLIVRYYSA